MTRRTAARQGGPPGRPEWILIPERPPSHNDFKVAPDGRGAMKYRALRRKWGRLIGPRIGPGWVVERGLFALRILGPGERAFDDQNYVSGLKPVIDALVAGGHLLDDRPSSLDLRWKQAGGLEFDLEARGPALLLVFFPYGGHPVIPRELTRRQR